MEALSGVEAVAGARAAEATTRSDSTLAASALNVGYGAADVLKGVSLTWLPQTVNALIGPSGCGKTTLLRTLNRLVELAPGARVEGSVTLGGADVMAMPPHEVRRRVGMVFQRPNPFPMSIFDNVAYALRDQASRFPRRRVLAGPVEEVLTKAALWNEVKDDLGRSALRLSGGQQQRLCIARVIAARPDVILMDEPCSSLDPRSTAAVEELIGELRVEYTVIVVTHNLAQAARVADRAALLYLGEVVEEGDIETMLTSPAQEQTRDFVAGLYGVKVVVVILVGAVAATLVLGAWANGFERSTTKAAKLEAEAPVVAKPEEVEFKGGPVPAKVVALLTDEVNGTVAVVAELTNPVEKRPATDITIGIELLDDAGKVVGTNTDPGTDPILNHIASIGPGETVLYVNDTIIPEGTPASATVHATGTPKRGELTEFEIVGAKVEDSPFGVSITGSIRNPGTSPEEKVHVEAVVRQGTQIVGAGGALVDRLEPGGEAEFQIFVIGKSKGDLEVWAPPQ